METKRLNTWAVVPAAGAGRRMGLATAKQYLNLGGRPILVHAVQALAGWPGLRGIVVACPPHGVERTSGLFEGAGLSKVLRVVAGGEERQDSVRLGLEALIEAKPDDVVFVHDAVRPFPPVDRFPALRDAAYPDGALFAIPSQDTLKREADGASAETLSRNRVWQAQTPQAFPVGLLREALRLAADSGFKGTDDASLVEALGRRPRFVAGDSRNIKVTTPEDLRLARALLAGGHVDPWGLHVGHGYDVHRLVAGRKLVLGGVEIPHHLGLLGHSDADVLAHAVADACLGAAGLGDIGRHFPDTDPAWAGACSLDLLARVAQRLDARGLRPLRVDATVIAERPKVAGFIPEMETNLARSLGLPQGRVTVKATTTEGLGFEGRMEGISSHAIALVGSEAMCSPIVSSNRGGSARESEA